jgi:uncharacterized protein (DUF2336 family)
MRRGWIGRAHPQPLPQAGRGEEIKGKAALTTIVYGRGMSVEDRNEADPAPYGVGRLLGGAAAAESRARARLGAAADALLRPDRPKLYDARRVAMAGLFARLIGAIEDELRHRLAAMLDPPHAGIIGDDSITIAAPVLRRAGLAADKALVAALMRRADEHRLGAQLRLAAQREGITPLLDALMGDPELAGPAMSLLVADSRRFDRFHEPALGRTDLSAELQHRLVWRVAAALRTHLVDDQGLPPARADQLLTAAANATLAEHDEGETLEARAMRLALRMRELDRLDDAVIVHAFVTGLVALGVAGLAVRAGIPFHSAWDMALDEEGSGLLLLLRAVDAQRIAAAEIALRLVASGVADRMEAFDQIDPADAREAIRPWRLDPAYRKAIAELGGE